MTWTNIHLTNEVQSLLIKAAALQKVSVEELASQILDNAVKEKLAQSVNVEPLLHVKLPLGPGGTFEQKVTVILKNLPNKGFKLRPI